MSTPPRVSNTELAHCLTRITTRRHKVDDPDRDRLPDDPAQADPREVLDYLQTYSSRSIPDWVRQADVLDAITLQHWLWWQDRRRELHWLKAGIDRGFFLSHLAAQMGIRSRQGVRDRVDRLEALLHRDRPNEQVTRAARRAARAADTTRETETAWVQSHENELDAIVAGLVQAADRYGLTDDEREWTDELARDAREREYSPGSITILGMAASEIRTAPAVLALDSSRPFAVHTVLAQADRLRSSFAEPYLQSGR